MSILAPSDFSTGRYYIPLNPAQQTGDLPDYINRVEAYYLPRLFGKVLFDLFIIDYAILGTAPTAPRFVFVFDPFTTQETQFEFNESLGIKAMLKGFVYYLYLRDNVTRPTNTGLVMTESANAIGVSGIKHDLNSRYNESIATFKSIQYYMDITNPIDYPEYEGIALRFNHTF